MPQWSSIEEMPFGLRSRTSERRKGRATRMTLNNALEKKHTDERGVAPSFFIREMRLDQDLSGIVESWKQCNLKFYDHTIHCDPDWLQVHFEKQKNDVRIYFCERDGELVGVVPFHFARQPLLCQLGDLTLAKFPLRVLRLQGYTPNLPENESAYNSLFNTILSTRFDAIFMNYVKADSFFWNYLQTSPFIRKLFRFYSKRGPEAHQVARLNGTFVDYMQRYSAKTRNTLVRKARKLRDHCDIQIIKVTEESQVEAYLTAATEISRKTWQFKRLGWGIGASDPDVVRGELKFLARRGWLRAYLLKCGEEACSFILGWQYGSRFYHAGLGFDPVWEKYSVGTVLLLFVLEDLYKDNRPELYDFGTYAEYKERFCTESYPEAIVWLFRRRPYPIFADCMHRTFSTASRKSGALLNRLGLKARIKHFLRAIPGHH